MKPYLQDPEKPVNSDSKESQTVSMGLRAVSPCQPNFGAGLVIGLGTYKTPPMAVSPGPLKYPDKIRRGIFWPGKCGLQIDEGVNGPIRCRNQNNLLAPNQKNQ